eukprot:scaffold693_cov200-Alexandrium_tamarense.AAC.17
MGAPRCCAGTHWREDEVPQFQFKHCQSYLVLINGCREINEYVLKSKTSYPYQESSPSTPSGTAEELVNKQ